MGIGELFYDGWPGQASMNKCHLNKDLKKIKKGRRVKGDEVRSKDGERVGQTREAMCGLLPLL